MVDEGDPADEDPGQVLCQISDCQEGRTAVFFLCPQIDHISEGRDSCPPDQGIAEGTDSLPQRIPGQAGIVPDGPFHNGPVIPGRGIGVGVRQGTVVVKHGGLVVHHAQEQSVLGVVLKGEIGQQVDGSGYGHEKAQAE